MAKKRGATRGGKFHGVIEEIPPAAGEAIADKERAVVAVRSITFGNLPGPLTNDICLAICAETDKDDEGTASGAFKVDLLKYVKDHGAINISDLVIFSGRVFRHLTLRCSIDELDEASVEPTRNLIAALLGLATNLVGAGATKTVLGGLPALIGALLSFNKDDQVLVLNHSFYTNKVTAPGDGRLLRSGIYTFKKRENASAKPQVEMTVERA